MVVAEVPAAPPRVVDPEEVGRHGLHWEQEGAVGPDLV